MKLKAGMKILFDGDSITDANRDREDRYSLAGYSREIAGQLAAMGIECFNRGISGNRSCDLLARLEAECEEIRPDLISLLIGINDVWRRYDSNDPTSSGQFEENYRAILKIAKKYAGQIVILEPFLLPVDPDKERFREDLDPKIRVVRKLAREFAVTDYLPLDGLFAEACVHLPPENFSFDGVHPTEYGHRYIAGQWLGRAETGR